MGSGRRGRRGEGMREDGQEVGRSDGEGEGGERNGWRGEGMREDERVREERGKEWGRGGVGE